jgi:pyruvate ferredoxin oxidoreductase alpha subunit
MGKTKHIMAPEHADQLEMTEREVDKRWRRLKIKHEPPEL